MLAHFANNFLAVYFLYKPEGGTGMSMESIPLWLVGVTLPVGVGALVLYEKRTRGVNGES